MPYAHLAMSFELRGPRGRDWSHVAKLRGAADFLARSLELPAVVLTAVAVAVEELAENLIKYHCWEGQGEPCARLTMGVVQERAELVISSQSQLQPDREHLDQLKRVFSSIEVHGPREAYTRRVSELAAGEDGGQLAQLGLYRIAVEGGFALTLHHADDAGITITATLPLSS